jgi:hypothetical protein
MTEEERRERAQYLQSPGVGLVLEWAEERAKEAWVKFIKTPVDKKTSKAAFAAQAEYMAFTELKDWVESEIKLGE